METISLPNNVLIQGNLLVIGAKPAYARSELTQEDNARFKVPLTDWRVWDNIVASLPNAAAADDLGLIGGAFGAGSPSIQTGDLKSAGATTRRARVQLQLPHNYVAGQSATIRAKAGMLTTVADAAATIDFEAYKSNDEAGIGADLVTTAALTINSLVLANKDFTVTPTGLAPGDTLDIRLTVIVNDAATVTAVIGIVGAIELLLDVKG